VADFACLDPKLVVEVDGDSHIGHDESRRTGYLESMGFRVVRVTNEEVQNDLDGLRTFLEDVIRVLQG
jgi:5-methyltetrahydrofolate--homocysteine methyltransferase